MFLPKAKVDEFRYLKSQLTCPGELNNADNLPRTFSRLLDNRLDRRERSRLHLWQNRNSTRAQDSLDCVSVVSPSLVESLLQCSSENRIMPYCTFLQYKDDALLGDKMQFDWFVKVAPASEKSTVYTSHHLEVAQNFTFQLRSVTFNQDVFSAMDPSELDIPKVFFNAKLREFKITELQPDDGLLAIISLNGSQLESLVLEDGEFFAVCASLSNPLIPMMLRLKKLQLAISTDFQPIQIGQHFERVIPWHQLISFSVKFYFNTLRDIYQCGLLLDLFGQMAQLRQLSISVCDLPSEVGNVSVDSLHEFYSFIMSKTNLIQGFANLEIFRFFVNLKSSFEDDEVPQMYPNYRFFLDQFSPKFGGKLRKFVIKLPTSLESTHNCLAMNFSQGFRQLETLVLNFEIFCSNNQFEGFINYQDDGPIQSQTIRQLTIKKLENYYPSFLNQIRDIFPNLVELNIGNRYLSKVTRFTDQYFMQIISGLPHLRILRITDNIPKATLLYGSIDLMCKRAMELKPHHPMQFRIPLDSEFLLKFNQLPETGKAELPWIKAAKWIQVY